MIRAVLWKEWREQGLIAIMLAVLGGALLVAAATLADPPSSHAPPTDVLAALGAGRLLTLMLVVTAGTVCGGALFAAEKEAGTMGFLEALPTARWPLWRAKLTAGLVLAAAEVAVLLGVAAALGLAGPAFLLRLVIYALLAFSWGALGSTLARTTLGSVGIAIPAATLASFVFLLPISVFLSHPNSGMPRTTGWLLFEVLMVVTPLALSAWRFTALDRLRAADAVGRPTGVKPGAGPARSQRGRGVRALVWLTLRQVKTPGLVLSAFALSFGCSLLLPDTRPFLFWPAWALAAGVLAGVTAFGDEQSHNIALFWGEQRLPIGRAWAVKIPLHLGLLAWLLFLMALPSLLRAELLPNNRFTHGQTILSAMFHNRLFDELGREGWKYLLVPAAYGFAFGHVCGLLFRKLVVACGVALMLGGVAAAGWGPSLLAGGVQNWQVWLPAAAVLLTGRLIIRPWASDRVIDRKPLARVACGMAAAVALFAAGIGYRAVEVRDEPGGLDDLAFVESLPSYDENVAGREFRMAAERYARTVASIQEVRKTTDGRPRPRIDERLETAVRLGWPKEDLELAAWLDRVFAESGVSPEEKHFAAMAAAAADRPVGVYDPPQLISTLAASAGALENARRMTLALLGRGLQQQSRGDPGQFVPLFHTALKLARNLRHGGGVLSLEVGIEVERVALHAADRWLERLAAGNADQTLALARVAAEADDPGPLDLRPHLLADRYVIRGMMQAPNHWLTSALTPPGGQPEQVAADADLVATAWSVPWERERTRRLIGLAPDGIRPDVARALEGRPGSLILIGRNRSFAELADRDMLVRIHRRAMILKGAIRTFQSERGRPPAELSEIVTCGYLRHLPEDPHHQGRSFGYRISRGETLRGPIRPALPAGHASQGRPPDSGSQERPLEEAYLLPVDPGRVIIWSVGVDHIDQNGRVPPGGPRAEDIVFIVPAPATGME